MESRFACKLILVFICTAPQMGFGVDAAAQDLASDLLPDRPAPQMPAHSVLRSVSALQKPRSHRSLIRISIAVLAAGEALDSWTTYKNLTHPKWICGYSPAFGNAVTYISDDGKQYDPHTIQYELCKPGPSGQLANYAYDVTRTGAFTETEWTAKLHLAGQRNAAGVIAWNVADDAGQMLMAHYLGKRRGIIGRFAPGINFARGLVHFECGFLNLQFARTHTDASTWPFHLQNESTLYPGPRWWGRQ